MDPVNKALATTAGKLRQQKRQANRDRAIEAGVTLGEMFSQFLALPGLRGFWPMSSIDASGNVYSLSNANADPLLYNGNPTFNAHDGIIPYIDLDGTGDYLNATDNSRLDIIGTESYMASSIRGLTAGAWFWKDVHTTAADADGILGKWTYSGNQGSWLLGSTDSHVALFIVTGDGTTANQKLVGSSALSLEAWHFIVGRFTPSTELAIFADGVKSTNVTSIPASLFSSSADLNAGAYNAGANRLNGRVALPFLCASILSDTIIQYLFARTRPLFDV